MFVNSANYEDAKKYFQGCWIKVQEMGDRMYFVKEVRPDFTYLNSPSRGEKDDEEYICIDMQIGYTISYVIPKKTVFQHGMNALILERIPARMWKKGMDLKNTQFQILNNKSQWSPTKVDIGLIEGFVNKPQYHTFDTAQRVFKEEAEMMSVALSPRVSFSREGYVFVDTVFVGRYTPAKNQLTYKTIFSKQMKQLFPNVEIYQGL